MMTILSSIFSFIKSKPRLFIEYAMIATVLFLCGICGYLWVQNEVAESRMDAAEAKHKVVEQRLTTVEAENKKLGEAVIFLSKQREKDAASFKSLSGQLNISEAAHKELTGKLVQLEKTNEDVKSYLNERVPSSLRRMLDDTTAANDPGSGDNKS